VASPLPKRTSDPKEAFDEAVALVKAYARQETIEPLKNLKRFVGFGIAGGILIALGLFFFALAGLRYMQTHRFLGQHITGNWSWVPYMIVAVVGAVLAYLFTSRIRKGDDHA
jgi:uncharacterized BrkB/YihY/UPF0761 family membrane protein